MIELFRIVEHQANLYGYRATQNLDRAGQLEALIESTKPADVFSAWHPLISRPFRYSPPHPSARFRPEYGRNVFYASSFEETALYEHAFHFMLQRRHLPLETDTGTRTIFRVEADDQKAIDIRENEDTASIIDRNDYSSSHKFIKENTQASFILYPSCRDPLQRDNAAILDILHLEKMPSWEMAINFFYSNKKSQINWLDYQLQINWNEVA